MRHPALHCTAVACCLALLLVAPVPALGQPQQASPAQPKAEAAKPRRLVPPRRPAPGPKASPQAQPALVKPVEVDALAIVDPDSLGLLDKAQGGLGVEMWRDSERGTVRRLLAALPDRLSSPTTQSLARRLLLSAAPAPRAAADGGGRLIGLRLERLARLGYIEEAERLLDLVPGRERDEAMIRLHFDNLFLLDRTAEVCRLIEAMIQLYEGPHWRKVLAFCLTLFGNTDAGQLSARLLKEEGHQDETFYALMNALTRARIPDALPDVRPWHLAMARAAALEIPAYVVGRVGPAILRSIALTARAEDEVRLAAAFRAEALGALSISDLHQLLVATAFEREDFAQPFTRAAELPLHRALALLYQAARAQPVKTARAEVVAAILERAGRHGAFATTARVLAPVLDTIEPSPKFSWFARQGARAYYVAGLPDRAEPWQGLAFQKARYGGDAERTHVRFWPLARLSRPLAVPNGPPDPVFKEWQALQVDEAPDKAPSRVAYLLNLLEALGDENSAGGWQALMGRPFTDRAEIPSAAVWHGLRQAVRRGRLGETVLLVLVVLGPDGPAAAHPITLNAAIWALRGVGLEAEARGLALEAAIAATL